MKKKVNQFIIIFILTSFILISNIPNSIADWPTFRHDNLNSGYTESETPDMNQLNWTFKINGDMILISDNNLIYSDGIYLKCISTKNLTLKWKYKTIASFTRTTMAISDDKVYFTDGPNSRNRTFNCLDINDGTLIRSFPAEFTMKAPSVNGDYIFFSDGKVLYCINKNSGKLIWNYSSEHNPKIDSPATVYGIVICAFREFEPFEFERFNIICFNKSTGNQLWSFMVHENILSPITIYNEKVYFGSRDYLRCLKLNNGELVWKFKTNGLVTSAPAINNHRVFFVNWNEKIYCINSENGKLIWSNNTGGMEKISPTISDGRVFVGSDNGVLLVFDEKNGNLLWKYNTGHPIYSSLIINDGSIYVKSANKLFCFSKGHENKEQDLFINDYDLSIYPWWVEEGVKETDVTISAKVHNMGKMDGNKDRNFTVGFYELNGNVSSLIGRRNKTVSDNGLNIAKIKLKLKVGEKKRILVKIDETNFVEQNLTNNEAQTIIDVYADEDYPPNPLGYIFFMVACGCFILIIIFLISLLIIGIYMRKKKPRCLNCKKILRSIPNYNILYCPICGKHYKKEVKNIKRKNKKVTKLELEEIDIYQVMSQTTSILNQSNDKSQIIPPTTDISKQSIVKSEAMPPTPDISKQPIVGSKSMSPTTDNSDQPVNMQKSPYSCPTCNYIMFYNPWYGRWFCYYCGRYV